ncbi:replication protein RepA, partial [Enterobacter hormaechei subsp. steigerwaltii]|nr:replication protein RepA [Enterobacter hormaechei subsp. steigerwaltii]
MTNKKNGPTPVGDVLGSLLAEARERAALPPPKRERKKPQVTPAGVIITPQQSKLLDVAAEIATIPPSGEDMAFTHTVLCQVGLPRAKVEGREFMRQSGAAWVNVQAGYLDEGRGPVLQPIPYGVMPRLGLAWVSTFAVRNKEREIPIGDSAAEFLRL